MLVLTDMFGGTPANLAVTFVSPHVEVITGVNLPMLIKLARPQKAADLLDARARDARARPQRHLGRVGPAAGREAVTACAVTILNPLGLHARAAARFVHTASGFSRRIRVGAGRPRRWTARASWDCCCSPRRRAAASRSRPTAPTKQAAVAALCALVERGFDEAPCA